MPDICLHKYPIVKVAHSQSDHRNYEYDDISDLRESVEHIWFGIRIMLFGIASIGCIISLHLICI